MTLDSYLAVVDTTDSVERHQLADMLIDAGRQWEADAIRNGDLCVWQGQLTKVYDEAAQDLDVTCPYCANSPAEPCRHFVWGLWNWTNHIAGDVLDHCNEELGLLMESGRHVRGRLDQLQDGYRPAWLSTPVIAVSSFLGHDTPDPELDGFYVFAADADAFLRCVRNIRGGGGEADAETLVRRVMSKLGIDADAKGGAS